MLEYPLTYSSLPKSCSPWHYIHHTLPFRSPAAIHVQTGSLCVDQIVLQRVHPYLRSTLIRNLLQLCQSRSVGSVTVLSAVLK